MPLPEMPWYDSIERGLKPLDRYMQVLLLAIAVGCIYVAVRGTPATRTAMFVYLVSP